MGIEQGALGIGPQQRLVGVLAMDIDQPFADFAQLLNGGRRTVDVGARAATGIDDAAQQQFVVAVEIIGGQPVAHLGQAAISKVAATSALSQPERTTPASARSPRPAPGHRSGWTCRRRFRRSGHRNRRQLQLQPVDDDEILDGQVAQHQGPFGRSLHCSFWRSMAK
jgi:hypothetical protein